MSTAQSEYKEAQEQYKIIAEDSERSAELLSATEKLQQATANLKAVQKEAVQHNNESLFGSAGTAVGAIAGLVIGGVLSMVGAEVGKEIGKNFDFDVLGWLKGENGQTPVVASMYGDKSSLEVAKITQKSGKDTIQSAVSDFFIGRGQQVQSETRKQFETEQANKDATLSAVGEFFDNLLFKKTEASPLERETISEENFSVENILTDFSGVIG